MHPDALPNLPRELRREYFTLEQLLEAVRQAREVRLYVIVGDFWVEVVAQKTKLLAAIQSRCQQFREAEVFSSFRDEYLAEWLEDEPGVLVVGGEFRD